MKKILIGLLILGVAGAVMAAEAEQARIDKLTQDLERMLQAKPDSVKAVVPDILYEVLVGGQVIYITADGNYLLNGELFDLNTRVNLTEQTRNQNRLQFLEQLAEKEMIIYRATGEEKHVITVFTDIDCGYCRRLHRDMEGMNALGITVRYMAYPRSAPGTSSFNKSVSVWCAEDRNQAMTDAKLNDRVVPATCENAPVGKHQRIGQQLGVTGTPSILLRNGMLIPGYLPPEKLLETIEQNS